jgi:hypothetical protein
MFLMIQPQPSSHTMPTPPTPTRHNPEIELPLDAATAEDHRNPRRRRREAEEPAPELGLLVQPEPRHCLDKLILHPEVKTDIQSALRALEKRADLERIWNLSTIQPSKAAASSTSTARPARARRVPPWALLTASASRSIRWTTRR